MFARAIAAAKGNPGLQSLLTRQVVPDPDLADEAIAAVEAFHEKGETPDVGDLGAFFQKLTLEIYQKALTAPEVDQLRAGLIFEQAAPRHVMAIAGEALGVEAAEPAIERLVRLGLLDVIGGGDQALLSVNALARPLFAALGDDDRQRLASTVARPLADAWRDEDGELPRAEATIEIARLAEQAGDQPELHGEAAFRSRSWLYRVHGLAAPALAIVDSGLEALLATKLPLDPHMVRLAVECAAQAGNPTLKDRWLDHELGDEGDAGALAMIQLRRAERDIKRGEIEQAERGLQDAAATFKTADEERMFAITQGQIADIMVSRGELDEALRIRKEEQLPVLTRLGDVREIAITQGQIADILVRRGEPDEAIKLQNERLETNRRLDDPDGIAAAQWDLAQIELSQERINDAVPRVVEAYTLFEKLGRVDGIAVVGVLFGQILMAGGQQEKGRAVLEKSIWAFQKLGQAEKAKQVQALLDQIGDAA
ncbi:MAG: tetratricopeptide repeat protein [Alphaproteobacteria bacterium]|nr:tetratricopeptide repeat protein [Alphaproteobacteria bacterium]